MTQLSDVMEGLREDLAGIEQLAARGHPLLTGFRHGPRTRMDMEADLLSIAATVNGMLPLLDVIEVERADLIERGAKSVIAYHVAICSSKGIVPDESLYDPVIAARVEAELETARAALSAMSAGE